jgi:hypothetical protein
MILRSVSSYGARTTGSRSFLAPDRLNTVAFGVCIVGFCIALAVLMAELKLYRLSHATQVAMAGPPPAERASVGEALAGCESARDDRILLVCVYGYAGLARAEDDAMMQMRDLAHGRIAASALGALVPDSGEAQVAIAFLESSVPGSDTVPIEAIMKSYRRAAYLREEGLWRVWYASHHWSALDVRTQRAVLAEAVWYGTLGRNDRDAATAAVVGTPVFVPFALRLPR